MAVARIDRLARIRLNAADPGKMALFLIRALGFERLAPGMPNTTVRPGIIALALGPTRLDLAAAGPDARPYPEELPGWSPLFQHCALLVTDMAVAMARLASVPGWTAISTNGPERLPPASGGVTAFKFRAPEGHPFELLFVPDRPSGPAIDHSAISVADTRRSLDFYRDLGLIPGSRSLNIGPEQARLDALAGAEVEVTGLIPPAGTRPHLELLGYRGHDSHRPAMAELPDIAATRLVFTAATPAILQAIAGRQADRLLPEPDPSRILLRDPDGHLLEIELEANPGAR